MLTGWRTVLFNVGAAVLSVLIATNWSDLLPASYAWAGIVIVNVANLGLRFVTSTPVGVAPPATK